MQKPFRAAFSSAFSLGEDMAPHKEIRARIMDGSKVTGTNLCVLILAMLIASIGLNMNSTAVIIGAMLISPLMGSILGMAYGTVSVDTHQFKRSAYGFAFQVILSVLASTLYFLLSPIKTVTSELSARTSPTIYDILIAICGGLAGIIGQTRKERSGTVIPGVAIATALMPPLCTCGYAIANAQWRMLGGAFYLFFVNAYFIFISSSVILALLKVPKLHELTEEEWKRIRMRMVRNTVLAALPAIVFTWMTLHP